jgi:ferritin-like metal-binding protein YciE
VLYRNRRPGAVRNRRASKSLLSLCMSAAQEKSRPMLEANLKEEEQMAAWIDANVAKVTHQYVANQELRAA